MTDERRIGKKRSWAIKIFPRYMPAGMENTREKLRIAGDLAEIQTKHLPSTNLEHCCYEHTPISLLSFVI
jgi:hypothetical protein